MSTKKISPLYIRIAYFVVIASLLASCGRGRGKNVIPSEVSPTQGVVATTVSSKTGSTPGVVPTSTGPAAVSTSTSSQKGAVQAATTEPEKTESTEYGLTQFGLLTIIPETGGKTFTPQIISATKSAGVKYMRISIDWAISEPTQGQISFNTQNDQQIQDVEKAGLRIFPTLYVGSGWMNGSPAGRQAGGSRSFPPADLSKQWSNQTGYSPGYYNFVYTFFSHYKGHFDYVAIENEANSNSFWGGTADEYVRLLKTAYKAIKAADPQVTVVDSGFVSEALGSCIADDYLKTGSESSDQIIQFYNSYFKFDQGVSQVNTAQQLQRTLGETKIQEQCQRINYMLDNMGNSVDAVNFHFYENYQALPAVVEWLQKRTAAAGYNPAIVSNEMGVRNQGLDFAQSTTHAQEVIKDMVTSMSLGLRVVVWFSADTTQIGKDKIGLFDSNGQLRPAGNAFKFVINTMSSLSSFDQTSSTGPNLYHYIFENSSDVPVLDILWVEGNQESVQLQAPSGTSQENITDYSGKAYTATAAGAGIKLLTGETPLFVIWK